MQPGQDVPELPARDRVHARGGFVQQQDFGLVDQCAGQRQFLLHAAGELRGPAVCELGQAGELQQAFGAFFLILLETSNNSAKNCKFSSTDSSPYRLNCCAM